MAEGQSDTFWKSLYIYFNEMDFESQLFVKKIYKIIILTVAIISFIIAFFLERFSVCVYSTIGSSVLCILVLAPAWPIWKKNQPNWQQGNQQKQK
ncbi:unnamed protein product [Paramecium octaurelia]|uniref:Signal peptidase complex subunit 1 n=1 Tax=Paramecium octaurelia TaxID=43137 RepID=A0A8S1VVR0_PAROT|nr:unnamed protein product [Paramecium octaurelia]